MAKLTASSKTGKASGLAVIAASYLAVAPSTSPAEAAARASATSWSALGPPLLVGGFLPPGRLLCLAVGPQPALSAALAVSARARARDRCVERSQRRTPWDEVRITGRRVAKGRRRRQPATRRDRPS